MKKSPVLISLISILAISSGVALGISRNNKVEEVHASVGNYSTNASTYYNSITAISGKQLAGQLHDLITTTHKTYTTYDDNGKNLYQQNTDQYYENGNKVSGYIYEFYSGVKWPNAWAANAGDTSGGYNREHCWCQSLSNNLWGENGGGADMHHLRPVEVRLNSTRSNDLYGTVSNRDSNKVYAKYGTNTTYALGGYNKGGVFEPLDSKKGDVARIILYCYIHYNTYSNSIFDGNATTNGNGSSGYFGSLPLTNVVSASSESAALELMLQWNTADPVDEIEQRRNEQVAIYQGNRNPFIDNSGYANAIWGSGSSTPTVNSVTVSPSTLSLNLTNNTTGTLTANVSVSGGAAQTVNWSSNKTSVATVSNGVVTAKGEGTATITATSTVDSSKKGTCTVTVTSSGSGGQTSGTYTISQSDTFNPAFPTASGSVNSSATEHSDETSNISFYEAGIYKGSSSEYLMFVQNKGYLYNKSSLGTISSVAVTYSSSTSTSGKVGVYFGSSLSDVSTYTTTSNQTIAGVSQTDTFTNSTSGKGFFQLSTSNKNVQITTIVVTCSSGSTQTKTLSSISTSGQTTTYNVGDTFSYDGTLTATYSDNSTAIVTPTSVSSPDMSTSGTKTITLSYTEGGVTKTCTYNITVNAAVYNGEVYEKVTNGVNVGDEIIIVRQESSSSTSGYAMTNTILSYYYLACDIVSISNNKVTVTDEMTTWTVGGTSGAYTLYDGSKYLRGYVSNNYYDLGLTTDTSLSGLNWTITSSSSGYTLKSDQNTYLSYKTYNSTPEFAGASSSLVLYLYRKVVNADSFAQTFLDNLTCDSTGNNAPTLTMTWSQLNALYSSISSQSEKNLLKNATYTVNNNTVTPGSNTTQVVANAMSKYDIIVGKYSYTDFILRKGTSAYGYASVSINNIFKTNDNIPVIILVISLVSVTSIGGYFFLKRKKFDK